MKIQIITNCTVTRNFPPLVRVRDIPEGTMAQACNWWAAAITEEAKTKKNLHTPGEIYAGHSYTAVTEMANLVGHKNIHIVTGGQGLINLTQPIVPYDFTSDKKAQDNIWQRIKGEKFLPTLWWQMINGPQGLHPYSATGTPVADLVRKHKDDVVLMALTKGFIKYIVADLASLGSEILAARVFIPISGSQVTSFPRTIRQALVPFDGAFVESLGATRYDRQHQVVMEILRRHKEGQKIREICAKITSEAVGRARDRVTGTEEIEYDVLFTDNPELLKCDDADKALQMAKILGVSTGGKHRFRAAWRGAKGELQVDIDKETKTKGVGILQGLLAGYNKGTKDDAGERQLLERCATFVQLLKEAGGESFNAALVADWGKEMYGEGSITSAVKLAYVLEYNAKHLGIEPYKSDGKLFFKLADRKSVV